MLKAVIFDFDGVLVDTEPIHYRAFQQVLVPLGLGYSYERYVEHYIGFDDRDAFREAFLRRGGALDERLLGRLLAAKAESFRGIVAQGVQAFPGALDLVSDLLAHHMPLAIASGALHQEIMMILQVLGIDQVFSIIVAADHVARSKPDPETYQLALKRLRTQLGGQHLAAENCAVIEDTHNGIRAAKRVGLYCIGVTHSEPAASLQEADHLVASLEQLSFFALSRLLNSQSPQQVC